MNVGMNLISLISLVGYNGCQRFAALRQCGLSSTDLNLAGYPIYVSVDFNNDPLECTIWQFSRNLGLGGSFIHCIDSFSVKSKGDELGYRIREKYIGCQIYLCGEASEEGCGYADVSRQGDVCWY